MTVQAAVHRINKGLDELSKTRRVVLGALGDKCKYDRYLADVFYTDSVGNEQYLNNQILQNGLAVRMG